MPIGKSLVAMVQAQEVLLGELGRRQVTKLLSLVGPYRLSSCPLDKVGQCCQCG